jgi:preflagellin peptidase FlaK
MIESILSEPRIVVAFSMLAIASVMDLKNREVHDLVWIVFGSVGALLYLFEPTLTRDLMHLLFASAISAPMAYLAYRTGLFGGADALAIVALTIILPSYEGSNMLHTIAPLTIMTNAAIFACLFLIVNVARNTLSLAKGVVLFADFKESKWNKMLAFVLGYKANKPTYAYSIEMEYAGGKKFDFALKNAEKTDYCARPGSWVMAGLPFIVYLFAGLIAMVFIGDIMMSLMSKFIR